MAEPALKQDLFEEADKNRELKFDILDTHTEELIIGLCGPIGTDISFVAKTIQTVIEREYDYNCKILQLSDFIRRQFPQIDFDSYKKRPVEYYNQLIDAGNKLRENNQNSVLSELAINEITIQREIDKKPGEKYGSQRRCYIIDSIKNNEELELFRLVYRDIFYFIGVFSSLDNRKKNLEDKGVKTDEVFRLIDRDSGEEIPFGQKVSNTFMQADFFLRLDKSTYKSVEVKIRRFLNLIFESDIVTPSTHENAMYLAAAAAGNSACLSRQVGAAITDANGDVLAVGWNDVPKFGGGVYQYNSTDPASDTDHRCMNVKGGVCFNDEEKLKIADILVNELVKNKLIADSDKMKASGIILKSKIKELIEFSRAVHAEMLAIIHGSQKAGDKMINGRLYCTTYPCHNCARHIVASGIKEVYYIEPYTKSLAVKLHWDAVTEDESKTGFMKILMYEGIAPRRYLEMFKMTPDSRKNKGIKLIFSTKEQRPKNTLSLQAIPLLEKQVTDDLIRRNLIKLNS